MELQDAMQRLDISRDPRRSQPQQPPPQPQPQTRPQQQPPAQSSRESSRATSDHPHPHHEGGQADPSQTAASSQLENALRASHEQVWYLKSIDFISPSGASRKYNIILQNYNGCASSPHCLFLGLLISKDGEKAMFVHRNMQYPDPPRTDRDPSTRSQNRLIRLSLPTRRRAYPSHRARRGRVCSAIDDASNHE